MYFSDRAIDTRTWGEAVEDHQLDQRDGLTPRVGAPTLTQQTQPGRRTILAFTGHRPQRMGGFNPDNPTALWVRAQLAAAIGRAIRAGFRTFIAGGAIGFDYWAAGAVFDGVQKLSGKFFTVSYIMGGVRASRGLVARANGAHQRRPERQRSAVRCMCVLGFVSYAPKL